MTNPTAAAQSAPLTPNASDLRGRFVWYDLMTPDVDAAVAFYSAVAGWTTTQFDMVPGMSYTMWVAASGNPIGGVMALPAEQVAAGVPPHWIAYVGTPSTDATHDEAVSLGATSLVPPSDIPTVGRYAVLADPQGAPFALHTPADTSALGPEPAAPGVGEFSWHELYAADMPGALAFYQRLFGWDAQGTMDMGPMGTYQMFGRGEKMYGGMMNRMSDAMPPSWNLYARVPNLAAALETVKARGGQVVNGPMQVPGGDTVATCLDPRGGMFSLHEVKAG